MMRTPKNKTSVIHILTVDWEYNRKGIQIIM